MKRVKKVLGICMIGMLICGCSVDSQIMNQNAETKTLTREEQIEQYANAVYDPLYPVFMAFYYDENWIFKKKVKLDVYIDGNRIATLHQGNGDIFALMLSEGQHTVMAKSSMFNTDEEVFYVGKDRILEQCLPNIFGVTLKFKRNKAQVDSITGTNITEYDTLEEAMQEYIEEFYMVMSSYTPVGMFEDIMNKYAELNPANESLQDLENDFYEEGEYESEEGMYGEEDESYYDEDWDSDYSEGY